MADKKMTRENLEAILQDITLFSTLNQDHLEAIAAQTTVQTIPRDMELIREGDDADTLYILLRGKLSVFAGRNLIAEIGAGEPVGEIAFFTDVKRTASVTASRTSEVLVLTRADYDALSENIPAINQSIIVALANRIARSNKSLSFLRSRQGRIIAALNHGETPLPTSFVANLRTAISFHAGWEMVSLADIPKEVQASREELELWIYKKERSANGLVLVCEDRIATTEWANLAIENADDVYLIANAFASPQEIAGAADFEAGILTENTHHSNNLVLYRPDANAPIADTEKWLAGKRVHLHHHVALAQNDDFNRLARFMTGNALGLVMCGGGALGTAHVGFVKALSEQGYPIDMLGGTSVGAAMAGAFAMGFDADYVMDQCDDIFVTSKAMKKLTVPFYSVIDHKPFDAQMQKHYGAFTIENLPINYFAVSSSLTKNDLKVLRVGELWEAVRSSTSIPAIFPPFVSKEAEVLVDGAVVNNAPIDIMRTFKTGPNILFYFKYPEDWRIETPYDALPGRGTMLSRLIAPWFHKRLRWPKILSILSRTLIINSRKTMQNVDREDDIFFNFAPPKNANFLDWKNGRKIYELAHKQLTAAFAEVDRTCPDLKTKPIERLRKAADLVNAQN